MWARDNWEDNLQRNTFKDSSFIFQGSLPSSIEENTSQKQGRGGGEGGYGVKSNDNIASMEQANQLSAHPLAIDAVKRREKHFSSLTSTTSKKDTQKFLDEKNKDSN